MIKLITIIILPNGVNVLNNYSNLSSKLSLVKLHLKNSPIMSCKPCFERRYIFWSQEGLSRQVFLQNEVIRQLEIFNNFHYRYSQTCLSDPLYITTSFVSRPYLFPLSVFPCIQPLYNDQLSNATNDRVLWVKILHITIIKRLLSNRKLDNK